MVTLVQAVSVATAEYTEKHNIATKTRGREIAVALISLYILKMANEEDRKPIIAARETGMMCYAVLFSDFFRFVCFQYSYT